MKSVIEFFARQHMLVNLLTIFIMVIGLYVTWNTRVETFPSVDYDIILVTTVFPGASALEVERLVTRPIEDALKSISGFKELDSYSIENSSLLVIQLDADVADKNKIVRDIERAVDNITDLPEDAEDPIVNELNSQEFPIIEFTISGPDDFEQLRGRAKILADRLADLEGVSSVAKLGYREREIQVNVSPSKIPEYYVSISEIIAAIKTSNIALPGGKIIDPKDEIILRTNNEFTTASDVMKTVVRSNASGKAVFVSDVANVVDGYKNEDIDYRVDGKNTIVLTCVKKEGFDTIKLVSSIERSIDKFKKEFPEVKIKKFNDMSYYTKRRLKVLINNAIIGLIGIMICMLIFLNPLTSIIASIGIPFSIFATLILFKFVDISINMISMVGFIMVLGMLVDDAVVVAENITYYLERGMSAADASVRGAYEVLFPVVGSVMTTILAFFPLMFIAGIMGKFLWAIPFVIIMALSMSLFESVFILPSHFSFVGKFAKVKQNKFIVPLENLYRKFLNKSMLHKGKVVVFLLLLSVVTVWIAKTQMKIILFPGGGIKMFVIRYKLPDGSSLAHTSEKVKELEEQLASLPKDLIEVFITTIGTSAINNADPYGKTGSEYGVIKVYLPADQTDAEVLDKLKSDMRYKIKSIKGFDSISVEDLQHGPPQGKPVDIAIRGDRFETLVVIMQEYMDFLATIKGVSGIETNHATGKTELEINVNEDAAASLGVDPSTIASTIRAAFEGVVASKIKDVEEEIDIRVIFPENLRKDLHTLEKLKIQNKFGKLIPLTNLVSFKKASSIRRVRHKKNIRTISVSAQIDADKITSFEVNNILKDKFKDISVRYPGYSVEYGGEFKDTQESFESIGKALLLALILVFISIAVTSNSTMLALLIMLSIPFGFIGIIWAFFSHGYPISFLGMIGMVGMAGVVVNNSIVLASIITRNLKEGMPLQEAIVEGSVRRLRAVILTTVTTLIGLFPTAYGIGGKEEFIQPMVLALAWGLVFGAVLTLGFFPVNFYIMQKLGACIKRKTISKWMSAAVIIATSLIIPKEGFSAPIHPGKPLVKLSVKHFIQKVIKQNYDCKQIQYSVDVARFAWKNIYAMYDPKLQLQLSYLNDEKIQASELAARDFTTSSWNLGLSKKFSFGLSAELAFEQYHTEYTQAAFSGTGITSASASGYSSDIYLQVTQSILANAFGRQDRLKILSLKEDEKKNVYNLQSQLEDTILGTLKIYFAWVQAHKNLVTRNLSLGFSKRLLSENIKKLKKGLLEDRDVLTSKLLLMKSKNELLIAENNLQSAWRELLLALGDSNINYYPEDIEFQDSYQRIDLRPAAEIIKTNKRIKALERELSSNNLKIRTEGINRLPEINLSAKYETNGYGGNYKDTTNDSFQMDKYPAYYLGLTLTHSFNYGTQRDVISSLMAERRKILTSLRKFRGEISNKLHQGYENLKTNAQVVKNLESILEQQIKKLKLEEKAYQLGRTDINNLINIEQELSEAYLQRDNAIVQYHISYYSYLNITDELLKEFGIALN